MSSRRSSTAWRGSAIVVGVAALAVPGAARQGTTCELPRTHLFGDGGGGVEHSLGGSLSPLGDLDGDGITDLAVGRHPTSGGIVHVLRRSADGRTMQATVIDEAGSSGFTGVSGGEFGAQVSGLGDVDGNGVPDLAVASPASSVFQEDGELWILLLESDGTVLGQVEIDENGLGGFGGTVGGDHFASAIAGPGDVNDDGIPDVALRVGGYDGQFGPPPGPVEIWMLFLDSDGTVKDQELVQSVSGDWIEYGESMCGIGDLDDNGVEDLALGTTAGPTGGDRGTLRLLLLEDDGSLAQEVVIDPSNAPLASVLAEDAIFARDVEGLGDVDGDGFEDIAVTASEAGDGVVLFLHMNPAGGILSVERIDKDGPFPLCATARFRYDIAWLGSFESDLPAGLAVDEFSQVAILDRTPLFDPIGSEVLIDQSVVPYPDGEEFGAALASVGDLNANGYPDLAIMSRLGNPAGWVGSIRLVMLGPGGSVESVSELFPNVGNVPPLHFRSMVSPGDVDGDGVSELVIGDYNNDRVEVLFLHPDGSVRESQTIDATSGGMAGFLDDISDFGAGLVAPGDVDGDGTPDLGVLDDEDNLWILRLLPDGTVHDHHRNGMDFFVSFGALAPIGDLDGNGVPDLIGANQDGVVVFFLRADGEVESFVETAVGDGFYGPGPGEDPATPGSAFVSLGDRTGDGTVEVVIGDRNLCFDGGMSILSLASDGSVVAEIPLGPYEGLISDTALDGHFGAAFALLEQADGGDLLAVGAPFTWTGSGGLTGATWLLELETFAPSALPIGCDVNPVGSLTVAGGWPTLGETLTLAVDNPLGTQAAGSLPFLVLSFASIASPCGVLLPGWGMASSASAGELSVSLSSSLPPIFGPLWAPGSPSPIALPVPNDPCQVGLAVYAQGALFDPTPGGPGFGLTNALGLLIGS